MLVRLRIKIQITIVLYQDIMVKLLDLRILPISGRIAFANLHVENKLSKSTPPHRLTFSKDNFIPVLQHQFHLLCRPLFP